MPNTIFSFLTTSLLVLRLHALGKAIIIASLVFVNQACAKETNMSHVLLKTNYGDVTIELDYDKAPKSAANFANYVEEGFYNGVIFHRVINGFMIQGGGFDTDMQQKSTNTTIENEADNGLSNDVGSLAMARTSDPHSASSQFFINVNNNNFLNHTGKTPQGWGYAVFGKVTAGMHVVEQIKGVKTTTRRGHQDVPVEPVIIESAEFVSQ